MISANESNELNELKFGSAKAEIKSDGKITERKNYISDWRKWPTGRYAYPDISG